jgi:hypothetical protein
MSALFPRRANAIARATLLAAVIAGIGVPVGLMAWVRTGYASGQHADVRQPIPFDHRIHARDLRIDCRFCHVGVTTSANAGLPPTTACVGCHNKTLMASAVLAPVRASLASNKPIVWNRVNALPDFVYFDHSIHVAKGVTCATCHGQVDAMGRVFQAKPLTMGWCLSCHRDPARFTDARPVRSLTSCSTCHR